MKKLVLSFQCGLLRWPNFFRPWPTRHVTGWSLHFACILFKANQLSISGPLAQCFLEKSHPNENDNQQGARLLQNRPQSVNKVDSIGGAEFEDEMSSFDVHLEEVVRLLETVDGARLFARTWIRSQDAYRTLPAYAAEMRSVLAAMPASPEARTVVAGTIGVLEKPLETMNPRELAWLMLMVREPGVWEGDSLLKEEENR